MKKFNSLLTRLKRQAKAWEQMAEADEFAGLNLAGFKNAIATFQAALDDLLTSITALKGQNKAAHDAARVTMQISKRVALAMKSHPNHGDDSELVRASGFVTESERRSGLTRKVKGTQPQGQSATA